MKKLEGNKIAKRIISLMLILSMILSYFPLSVFAADNDNNDDAPKIAFIASWTSNKDEEEGTTNDRLGFNYSLSCSGIPTGLQDVKIIMQTNNIPEIYDEINLLSNDGITVGSQGTGNGYAQIGLGNLPKGVEINGRGSVRFRNINSIENRNLTVKLTGKYIDPNSGEEHLLERDVTPIELKAHITPAPVVTGFNSNIKWDTTRGGKYPYGTGYHELYGDERYGTQDQICGYYIDGCSAELPIKIESGAKTQKLNLDIVINRTPARGSASQMEEGYSIDWGGLDADLGTPTKTIRSDGAVVYRFSKGEDEGYNSETAFSIDKSYTILVHWDIPNNNPKENGLADRNSAGFEQFTNVSFSANLSTIGYRLTNEFTKPEVATRVVDDDHINWSEKVQICSYFPGENAWIRVAHNSSSINDEYEITDDVIQGLKNTGKADIEYSVRVSYTDGARDPSNGNINFSAPKIRYTKDDGQDEIITLNSDQIKINSIKEGKPGVIESYFANGNIEVPLGEDGSYTVTEDINSCTIKLVDFLKNRFEVQGDTYTIKYTLNKEALGLSDNELNNISYIEFDYNTSGSTWIQGGNVEKLYRTYKPKPTEYSYMKLELAGNYDTSTANIGVEESKSLRLKMCKAPLTNIATNDQEWVKNENPVFYVSLPGSLRGEIQYDDITVESTNPAGVSVNINNLDIIVIDNEEYLVIPCTGVFTNIDDKENEIDIKVSYKRTLCNPLVSNYAIDAYMITDNEDYYACMENPSEKFVNKQGDIPQYIFHDIAGFSSVGMNRLQATTMVQSEDNGIMYEADSTDGKVQISEKENPLIVGANKKVTYYSNIQSYNETLKNISILSRLPKQNNTFIENNNQLIEADYKLPESFFTSYGNKVDGFTQGEAVSQTSLINLNVLGVYKRIASDDETLVPSDKYKIYVTNDADADFNTAIGENASDISNKFIEYVPGTTDLSNVKNIKVVLNEDYSLKSGETLSLKYEMTMPDESGMVGAQTAVEYTKVSDNRTTTLYSPAAYVIKGNTLTTIKIQKLFENYPKGVAPVEYGVNSLANIKFKLQYYDIASNTKKFLQINGVDVEATTDETGLATFDNIPAGKYYLYEVTTFENYSGINGLAMINARPSETVLKDAMNYLKRGNVVINKTWLGESERTGNAQFKLSRQNKSNEVYTYNPRFATMTGANQITITDVPYGTYEVQEMKCSSGWAAEEATRTVEVGTDANVTTDFNNIIGKGTLKIEKTVPEGETVDGLTFHITGNSILENPETLPFNPTTDLTIKIGETYPENVTVEKSMEDTKAVITISNLYLGYYHVEEINIPYIDGTEIEKYVTVSLDTSVLTNGETKEVKLANNYKSGTLKIVKTADEGVELDQFKVNVRCDDTLYHTSYNKTFSFPSNGILYVTGLYLGNYTITEVESDYFDPIYENNKQLTSLTKEVKYNKTTEATIHNENGVGYIKILKTLEGKDASKTIGIKFRLYGKQPTGADYEQIITITDTEEINGVTYGVGKSTAIPAGGEYELMEVQNTVPQFFVEAAPIKVDVKKQYTETKPLPLQIENKRGKGNLEISTRTVPEGGPLSPIRYSVQEIEIDENNAYRTIGQETQLDAIAGWAEMKAINSGYYLVKQLCVPSEYEMDVPQIVEVPIEETGYAQFEIEKIQVGENTSVRIQKEILNAQGRIASTEEIQAAKLNENESFEAKIVNVETGKEYYSFFGKNNTGTIKGLKSGRYEIEEVFKPKYSTYSYLIKNGDNYVAIEKDATTGKYYFEIPAVTGAEEVQVDIKIQNVLDTEFGLGGQKSIDNLSTIGMEQVNKVTKTIIYITDENGNALSGVGIKLFKDGQEVALPYDNNTYVSNGNKKVCINGLPVGTYTIKTVTVPNGYIKPEDKTINIYQGATMVTRIEVWKNRPVGSLTLSTTYTSPDGVDPVTGEPKTKTIYVPRSKYKILEPETGRVLTFEKTASGNYVRSKSKTATDTISLRAGKVEVTGIEVGNYQLGLVDMTETYGIDKTEPEALEIVENTKVDKNIGVIRRYGFTKVARSLYERYALNANGKVYIIPNDTTLNETHPELSEVEIEDFVVNESGGMILLDKNGKVWTNTNSYTNGVFVCMNDLSEEHPFKGLKIKSIALDETGDKNNNGINGVIDENGKLWCWGKGISYLINQADEVTCNNPVCLSDNTILENVQLAKVDFGSRSKFSSSFSQPISACAIDKDGELYTWGSDYNTLGYETNSASYEPKCITKIEGNNLYGKKIKDIEAGAELRYFIDSENNLWVCGTKGLSGSQSANDIIKNPLCLTKEEGNPLFGKKIVKVSNFRKATLAVDTDGKLYGWGETPKNLGVDVPNITAPICISDCEENELDTVKIIDITPVYSYHGSLYIYKEGYVCLDENGELWAGNDNISLGYKQSYDTNLMALSLMVPRKINYMQNSYFDLIDIKSVSIGNKSIIALNKSGKLWIYGEKDVYCNEDNDNLNSTQPGSYLDNITVKSCTTSDRLTVILDSDNKLWTIGLHNRRYLKNIRNSESYGNEEIRPICVSDKEESGIKGIEIKYATCNSYNRNDSQFDTTVMAVIDNAGRLYTAGRSGKICNLGYTVVEDFSEFTKFECLNDKYLNLSNVKFEKVFLRSDLTAIAVDTDGSLWTWGHDTCGVPDDADTYTARYGNTIVPTKMIVPNNIKFVDAICDSKCGTAIDKEGNVYTWNDSAPTLLTSSDNLLAGKKIVKIGYGYKGYVYAIDENGEIFEIDEKNAQVKRSITAEYEIVAKDMFSSNGKNENGLVIFKDADDILWALGDLKNGETASEPQNLVEATPNDLYGKTVKDIQASDFDPAGMVITQEGEYERVSLLNGRKIKDSVLVRDRGSLEFYDYTDCIYGDCIDSEGKVRRYNTDGSYTLINLEIKFKKLIRKDGNSLYLLGEDGKLYYYNTELTELTGFNNIKNAWMEYKEHYYVIFAQDSSDNLWFKVINSYNLTETNTDVYKDISGIADISDTTTTAQKVSDYTGGSIKQMYMSLREPSSSTNTNPDLYVYVLDENDNLWSWGAVSDYLGKTENHKKPTIVLQDLEAFPEILADSFICRTKDKSLWIWGDGFVGTTQNMTSIEPRKVLENIEKYQLVCIQSSNPYFRVWAAKDTNGTLWMWGQNIACTIGPNMPSNNPINMSENMSIGKIKDFSFATAGYPEYWVITEDNKVYYWAGQRGYAIPMLVDTNGLDFSNSSFEGEIVYNNSGYVDVNNTKIYLTDANGEKYLVGNGTLTHINNTQSKMYVLGNDGKVYFNRNGHYVSISEPKELGLFNKEFRVIKDKKYFD